ncbi:hypothetical protein BV25DRAFT_1915927 [Artomyces pyxidatus]|uniref:Uncharacterized protein n=1 Tax=Artomyces pyxidatus TaxID=48021 RepID=A0ACB8T3T8_9AGAM|nr:hypothetical protein BV25DRAFT_1915927 [Artomyces pyxidatus]
MNAVAGPSSAPANRVLFPSEPEYEDDPLPTSQPAIDEPRIKLEIRPRRTETDKTSSRRRKFECNICFDNYPEALAMRLEPCRHAFCSGCVLEYVATRLEQNKFPVPCPVCAVGTSVIDPGRITYEELDHLNLTSAQREKWTELEMADVSVHIQCRRCQRSAYVDKQDLSEMKLVNCPFGDCSYVWCQACQQEIIPGRPPHRCDGTDKLDRLMAKKGWKYCPTCNTPIQKAAGCDHIICSSPGCNTHFCYRCGEIIIRTVLRQEVFPALSLHKLGCEAFREMEGEVDSASDASTSTRRFDRMAFIERVRRMSGF